MRYGSDYNLFTRSTIDVYPAAIHNLQSERGEPMDDVKNSVQRQFAPVAANYATSAVHVGGPDLLAMLDAAELRGDEQVLDAGCGTGHTALAFAPRVAEVVAVDLTEAMLAQGRKLARQRDIANITFKRGDVEQLAFP